MFCPKCGMNLPENAQFCANCGSRLNPPTVPPKEPSTPAPQTGKKKGKLRAVALVLICSLLTGAVGFAAGYIVKGVADKNRQSSEQTPEGFAFLEGIRVLPEDTVWETLGNQLIVPADEQEPQVGEIIVFGTEKAIKVESVEDRNGETVITYSSPELYEFLDSMNLEGEAELDFGNFIPADGVTVISGESVEPASADSADSGSAGIVMLSSTDRTASASTDTVMTASVETSQKRLGVDDWFDVDEKELAIEEGISLKTSVDLTRNVELEVDFDIAIPTVAYKFDIDFDFKWFDDEPLVNVKNAYVQVTEDITVTVTVKASDDQVLKDDLVYPDYIEIGTVPLVGIDGVGIVLEVDLVLTPEGVFEIQYNVFGSLGVQVLNNVPENISALQDSVSVGISGDVKVGPQLRLLAEVFGKDLLSFSAEAGIKAGGSVNWRSTGVVCMDAGITSYAEIDAFENCLIGDWLNIAVKFTLIDEDNSPINITGHWENLQLVDACSYNSGTIQGTVASADDRTEYIENATITILNHEDLSHRLTVYSDQNGAYVAVVPGDTYLIQISADGYIPFESLETVGDSQVIYLETYLLVEGDENSGEKGEIGGCVSDSVNGLGVSGATLTVRKGWNMTSGEAVLTGRTDSNGYYSMDLPLGNYTISVERDGYVSNHINVAVTRNGNMNCNAVITPDSTGSVELGDMRVVLTWVGEPSDLDSHLWYISEDGREEYHIYYSQMYNYDASGEIQAYLDVDDINYYGPETITVYNMNADGNYRFCVHDFTNRGYSHSTVLANSGAKVQVYMGEVLIAQYYVPTSGVGNVWHVFDFDAETGAIIGVNTFETESDPGNVGAQ